jgi:hypothetical protein
MWKLIPILLVFTTLSCGSPQQTADTIKTVSQVAAMACRSIAVCMPQKERNGLTPLEFCNLLDATGKIAEFITRGGSCPIE